MKIDQIVISPEGVSESLTDRITDKSKASLVLAFSDRSLISEKGWYSTLHKLYPSARIISCTTSGDIADVHLSEDRIVATAIETESSHIHVYNTRCSGGAETGVVAAKLAEQTDIAGLRHVFLISDGQLVNGTDLIEAFNNKMPASVSVSGGLAGDAARFQKTLVGIDDDIAEGNIAAICFYGENLNIGLGTKGGWDTFGPERIITKSENNLLYELDGKNALELYKTYLGDKAKDLPGAALLFPLRITTADGKPSLVRTILNINEADQSMVFAGDMPVGSRAQLMKANFDKLIDGAGEAAELTQAKGGNSPELALLVSCVGRKLVLGQRTEEELDAVREILGEETVLAGFYSYGELCSSGNDNRSDLHNQTMTITTISES
ncbi:MAG: FIST N-terminal domain-containing protein [Bacteroidota bacterium]